jgi:hypothetical protein
VTRGGEPEQRIAEALRAQASGAGRVPTGRAARRAPASPDLSERTALVLVLAAGILFGIVLALLSLLAPGVLPPLG